MDPSPARHVVHQAAGVPLARAAAAFPSSTIRDLLRLTEQADVLSLAGGLPADDAIPVERIAAASEAVLGRYGTSALQYGPTAGVAELRSWIAGRLAATTGRTWTPEQVLVVTGSQQGFDLVTKVLVDPGTPVAVEDPCYVGALQAFRGARADLRPVRYDGGGPGPGTVGPEVRLFYTVPSFGNPTGVTIPEERRRHLAELAERRRWLIVEDGPYDELWFDQPPPPPVAAWTDRVVSLGTFSKTLAPGLRVGWVAGPPELVPYLERVKQAADLHTSSFAQRVVLEAVTDEGWWPAHLDRLRVLYRRRRDALLAGVRRHLDGVVETERPGGGMFLWARAAGVDTAARLPAAVGAGVAYVPGSAFAVERALPDHLRLSFATVAEHDLDLACARLASALTPTAARSA